MLRIAVNIAGGLVEQVFIDGSPEDVRIFIFDDDVGADETARVDPITWPDGRTAEIWVTDVEPVEASDFVDVVEQTYNRKMSEED